MISEWNNKKVDKPGPLTITEGKRENKEQKKLYFFLVREENKSNKMTKQVTCREGIQTWTAIAKRLPRLRFITAAATEYSL